MDDLDVNASPSPERILITGGAGSLGRAFTEYLFPNYHLTIVDNNEWAVAAFKSQFPNVKAILDNFENIDPSDFTYIIHCAAYKHVNIGESNASSFIENNLNATKRFYDKCYGKILYISTDKAVEPISAYGATKMLAEYLTKEYKGSIARCGNFLHSSGSVIPIWEEQIKLKQPISITDFKMTRYVIEMPEAVKQIWAGFMAGQKLIIPEMREVTLLELLAEVLRRHGHSLDSYKPGIKEIGIRPGEKLKEVLSWKGEI